MSAVSRYDGRPAAGERRAFLAPGIKRSCTGVDVENRYMYRGSIPAGRAFGWGEGGGAPYVCFRRPQCPFRSNSRRRRHQIGENVSSATGFAGGFVPLPRRRLHSRCVSRQLERW